MSSLYDMSIKNFLKKILMEDKLKGPSNPISYSFLKNKIELYRLFRCIYTACDFEKIDDNLLDLLFSNFYEMFEDDLEESAMIKTEDQIYGRDLSKKPDGFYIEWSTSSYGSFESVKFTMYRILSSNNTNGKRYVIELFDDYDIDFIEDIIKDTIDDQVQYNRTASDDIFLVKLAEKCNETIIDLVKNEGIYPYGSNKHIDFETIITDLNVPFKIYLLEVN